MKTRRILSAFLLLTLLCSLLTTSFARADETAVPDPNIQAQAALLVDEDSGTVLYAKNEHAQLYPASLTKIMTCLLVLEAVDDGTLSLNQEITAPTEAFKNLDKDGSTAGIQIGETLTVENLLYCLMVVSANEAANILAVTVGGSLSGFVDMMNAKAKELGCEDTHFANPIGLQDSRHYTSAWDLYLITKEALTHDEFMEICDTSDVYIPATNLSEQRHLYTTNYLLSQYRASGYLDSDAHGIKTGSTSDAGHCLVSSASRGGLNFLSVVLGAAKTGDKVMSFSETSRLFNWGFANFSYQTVLTSNDMLATMPVTLSKDVNYVTLHPAEDVEVLLPNDVKPEDLTRTICFEKKTAEAPVKEGDALGAVKLSKDDTVYATVPLVALNDVTASKSLVLLKDIQDFFSKTSVRILTVLVVLLLVALIAWKINLDRQRYHSKAPRRKRGYRGRQRRL